MPEQALRSDPREDAPYPGAIDAIRTRRSGHNFDPDEDVAPETLREIVRDATLAPSAFNLQPWEFVAVRDDDRIDDLVAIANGQEHLRDAGTAVVVAGHTTRARTAERVYHEWADAGRISRADAERRVESVDPDATDREYAIRNASLALQNLLLGAHARGLTALPMGGADFDALADFVALPDDVVPVALVAIGPSGGDEPERLPRRSVDDVLHDETF